jgi:hypothetical protein
MAKTTKQLKPVSPEPESSSNAESRALEHELRLWAELLLDIYLENHCRQTKKSRESKSFDVADREQ